jgi:hypothetical protein
MHLPVCRSASGRNHRQVRQLRIIPGLTPYVVPYAHEDSKIDPVNPKASDQHWLRTTHAFPGIDPPQCISFWMLRDNLENVNGTNIPTA